MSFIKCEKSEPSSTLPSYNISLLTLTFKNKVLGKYSHLNVCKPPPPKKVLKILVWVNSLETALTILNH